MVTRPIEFKWDKGTWSLNMAAWLEIPTNVEKQLHTFFGEYGKIFPDVLSALEHGMKDEEAWLDAAAK